MKTKLFGVLVCLLAAWRLPAQTLPPFTSQEAALNLEETRNLVTAGKSTIKGQLFVRDNPTKAFIGT